jgi:hypothetical protein
MSATIPIGADVGLSISGRPGTDDFGGDNCFEMHCFWIGVVQVPEDIAAAANEFEIAPLSVMQHLLLPNKIGLKLHTSREIMSAKKKQIPRFATDEEAERFVDTADLAEYDLTGGRSHGQMSVALRAIFEGRQHQSALARGNVESSARRRVQEEDSHATLYPHHARKGIDG